ncbi:UNVERIFIED_CONTAM: hypothetical protein Slati_0151100 [Sesamum latifolium]|uniref:Uncharacterized protein n=1 Tax=Sesamum latifolium TaxID=2727402 RepID=A0AAW2YAD1_9LAMI
MSLFKKFPFKAQVGSTAQELASEDMLEKDILYLGKKDSTQPQAYLELPSLPDPFPARIGNPVDSQARLSLSIFIPFASPELPVAQPRQRRVLCPCGDGATEVLRIQEKVAPFLLGPQRQNVGLVPTVHHGRKDSLSRDH